MRTVPGSRDADNVDVSGIVITVGKFEYIPDSCQMIAGRLPRCSFPCRSGNHHIDSSDQTASQSRGNKRSLFGLTPLLASFVAA